VFTVFGNWGDETEYFSPYAWVVFFVVLILNNVILFNFVIAQASDEYTKVVEKKEQSFFYLKANILRDSFFFFQLMNFIGESLSLSTKSKKNDLLLLAITLNSAYMQDQENIDNNNQEEDFQEMTTEQLDLIQDYLRSMMDEEKKRVHERTDSAKIIKGIKTLIM
jgi:hypothetical protein